MRNQGVAQRLIGSELINPGLDRTDVRGDWRLSHLGDTSSPYLAQRHLPFPASPRASVSLDFIRVSCPRFDPPGEGRADAINTSSVSA